MYGRTQEQPADDDGYRPKRGIYRYAVGLNWSKQTSRKYIVYRLQPIVSYDDKYEFTSNGDDDHFLSKFESNGNFLWTRTWGGPEEENGHSVAVDSSGNPYVTGFFNGNADFDPGDVWEWALLPLPEAGSGGGVAAMAFL